MASTPTRINFHAGYRNFPQNAESPSLAALDQANKRQGDHYRLDLDRTLSHTTSSPTALACHAGSSSFAFCAGSTAVLNHVKGDFDIKQIHFRPSDGPLGIGTAIETETYNASPLEKRGHSLMSPKTLMDASPSIMAGKKGPGTKLDNLLKPRSATCLALSHDGKYLAVGETGHLPRILLYDVSPEASRNLVSIATEHTYAIRRLSFSPDSRSLISIGDIHDGFIYLWSIGIRTGALRLQASNKCTAILNDSAWMGMDSFVTVGTRSIKVWRPDVPIPSSPTKSRFRQDANPNSTPSSPALKGLAGRNVLLGSLIEVTFTSVNAISDCSAVVGSDQGDVCLLYGNAGTHEIRKIFNASESVTGIAVDKKGHLWISCQSGKLWKIALAQINHDTVDELWQCCDSKLGYTPITIAGFMDGLLAMDTQRVIYFYDLRHEACDPKPLSSESEVRSHSAPVVGIGLFQDSAIEVAFFTYDTTGCVMFWTSTGRWKRTGTVEIKQLVSLREHDTNELRVLRASEFTDYFVAGDKHGNLSLLDDELRIDCYIHAHQSEVNDVALKGIEDCGTIIACAGRDHMIQIYRAVNKGLDLVQTIDQHGSSVNRICFLSEEDILLSLSSDRTIVFSSLVIRGNSFAFVNLRTLGFRQSPTAMAVVSGKSRSLAVATAEKQLYKYDALTGQLESCSRTLDAHLPITIDSMIARKGAVADQPRDFVIGYSSTDKSIRVQDLGSGSTITKAFGHSGSISDICVLDKDFSSGDLAISIVTCSLDGSVMLWKLSNSDPADDVDTEAGRDWRLSRAATPTRKILSKSSLTDFRSYIDPNRYSRAPTGETSPTRSITTTSTPSRSRSPKKPAASINTKDMKEPCLEVGSDRVLLKQGRGRVLPAEDRSRFQPIGSRSLPEDILQNLYLFQKELNADVHKFEIDTLIEVQNELQHSLNSLKGWLSKHGG